MKTVYERRTSAIRSAARLITLAAALAAPLLLVSRDQALQTNTEFFKILSQDFEHLTNNAQGFKSKAQSGNHAYGKWLAAGWALESEISTPDETGENALIRWQHSLERLRHLPEQDQIKAVNAMINQYPYLSDQQNWGKSDYWATPVEFLKRGGDCEDFVITKFYSLRLLGIPRDRMEIHVVRDEPKDLAHAVLVVKTDAGDVVLDNQTDELHLAGTVDAYTPLLHIDPKGMHLAKKTVEFASLKTAFSIPATPEAFMLQHHSFSTPSLDDMTTGIMARSVVAQPTELPHHTSLSMAWTKFMNFNDSHTTETKHTLTKLHSFQPK